jgi:hypothetical protein
MRYLLVALLVLCGVQVEAATLYIDPATASLNRGDAITVAVRLDTNEEIAECINAVDGVINYSDSVTLVDVSLGESILPVWVEAPTIDKDKRQITFAGGIPNGYCGRVEGDPRLTNVILELVFRAPGLQIGGGDNAGRAEVTFGPETTLYLNDGFGTKAETIAYGTVFTIAETIGSEIKDDWRGEVLEDEIPPEPFSITLERDDFAFENKYYISFNTTDKQTGLSHYEVIEESVSDARLFSFGAATAPWVRIDGPYVLQDQSLRSVVRVRAIDKAGNEYIATLSPQNTSMTDARWYPYLLAGGLGLGILLSAFLVFWLVRRRIKNRQLVTSTDTNGSTIEPQT